MSAPKFPIKKTQLLRMYLMLRMLQLNNCIFININVFFSADQHEFVVPKKCIKVPADITIWQKSEAYFVRQFCGFTLI